MKVKKFGLERRKNFLTSQNTRKIDEQSCKVSVQEVFEKQVRGPILEYWTFIS